MTSKLILERAIKSDNIDPKTGIRYIGLEDKLRSLFDSTSYVPIIGGNPDNFEEMYTVEIVGYAYDFTDTFMKVYIYDCFKEGKIYIEVEADEGSTDTEVIVKKIKCLYAK